MVQTGLLRFQSRLPDLGTLFERPGTRGVEIRFERGQSRDRLHTEFGPDITPHQLVQALSLRGQRVAERDDLVPRAGHLRLDGQRVGFQHHLLDEIAVGDLIQLLAVLQRVLGRRQAALGLQHGVIRLLHLVDDALPSLPQRLPSDIRSHLLRLNRQSDLMQLRKGLHDLGGDVCRRLPPY